MNSIWQDPGAIIVMAIIGMAAICAAAVLIMTKWHDRDVENSLNYWRDQARIRWPKETPAMQRKMILAMVKKKIKDMRERQEDEGNLPEVYERLFTEWQNLNYIENGLADE